MSITVLNLTEASALLRTINKRDIKDVRAIDLDLALVLESGHKIIISRGAVAAVNSPQLILEFADGDIALGDVFEKLNHIEVPADAAVTVTSKEITRYGIKRVVKPKVARNKQDQEADQDKKDEEDSAKSDADEARPAESLAGHDGSGGSDIPARKFTSGKGSSSSLALQELADAPTDAGSSKGGISWPVIAGGLGLLAAAGGGGGGGGGGSGAGAGSGGGSGGGVATTLSGAAALGPLNNATITAYDAEGRVIGKAVPVINGRYTLVLDQSGYKGLILLAIRDNTPGVRDNYADEASVSITDLGSTVLRAVALADGSNQIINVTALTELAALKAGLGTGQTNLAAAQVGATTVTGANAAVSSLFKVDILSGDVTPVTTTDAQGAAVINPAFLQSASVTARNYGIALKAIANLVQTNKERYADNGEAIRKLADALQFTDGLQRRLKWKDGTTQSDLFGDSLNARANDPALSQSVRDEARRLYDQLQKLPNGSSVSDYLLENHIGLPEPAILLKNTTAGGPVWAPPGNDGTVILNQDDITNGGLAVRAPPQSKVEVTFIGFDAKGDKVQVTLPASTADGSGFAVLRPPEAAVALLKQMTREQSVTAKVAVTDGDNSRSNTGLWQSNVDVRIDLNTPPGLTDFASNKIMLVNDTFYTGGDSNDDLRTTPVGHDDLLTSDGSVRVVLAGRIKSDERLQFAVATSKAANGQPVYGSWINPAELVVERIDSSNQVHYVARNLVNTEGMVWVKARVQSTGASRNGYGDARELDTPLQFTLDKTAPAQVQLVMADNGDNGLSNNDGITSQNTVRLEPQAAFEAGAEVHLRLQSGDGTSGAALRLVHANSSQEDLTTDKWYRWTAGDSLQLIGASQSGSGKARLQVRQIDLAGNHAESMQTFIADSTRVIEQTVLVASREKAVLQANAAVVAAQQALNLAAAADKAARQAVLDAARTTLQTAQAERDQALTQAGTTLIKPDGSTRLADLIGTPVEADYLPAILRAIAATADPDKVNQALGLGKLIDSAKQAAERALAKARIYGDNDANPALTAADFADNRSATGDEFSFTLDTTAPAKLVPSLLKPMSGGSTTDGTVLIGAAEAGALWEYSLDRGTSWKPGSGDRIKIKGIDEGGTDGAKSIQLRQTDAAGNVSVSDVFEFNLQTKLDAPALKVLDTIRTLPDGTALLDAASTTLPLGTKMVLEVTGRANMTAIITRDDGIEVGRTVLDASGKGRIELGRILTIAGLKSVAGANSTANGSYQLVHSSETIFKLRNTAPYFSNAFSELNAPVVDMSKPVYRTGSGDNDWYMWSAIGGGYVISRRNDSNEWYREAPSSTPAQSPEGVKTWLAVNRTAAQVADDQARNGMSTHQRALDGVTLVNANGWRDTPWTYKAIQEAGPDNRSAPAELKVRMFTNTPPALDLDAATSGLQSNLVLSATRADLLNGLPVLSSLAVPAGPAARSIELVFNNRSVSGNDALVLDTDVLMNADRARVEDRTVAGVNGVGYQATYDSASKTTTLMLSKTAGGMFSAAEVTSILKSISLRNRLDPATELSPRTIEVRLVDEGGRRSYDAARVTIQVEGRGLQVDLDAAKPGIQLTSTQYLNHLFVSTYGLAEGSHFVRDMAAPTGAPDTIALKFKGVHPINEMVYSNDAQIANLSGTSVYFGSIGGIFGLSWWSPRDDELLIRKTTPVSFSGDEVKKILEAMRMVTTNRSDIERSLEITLAAPAPAPDSGAVTGTTSRATLVMDTVAPDLDLNASQAGRQDLARSSVTTAQAAEGVKLIKGEMAAPLASDIASIVLTLPVPGTPVADRIFLGVERPFATNANFNHEGSIAGVEGLKAKFDLGTHLLTSCRARGRREPRPARQHHAPPRDGWERSRIVWP
nr:hypothetical protein [Herbaspirillum sp. B39]